MNHLCGASHRVRIVASAFALTLGIGAAPAPSPRTAPQRDGKANASADRAGDASSVGARSPVHALSSGVNIAPAKYVDWREDEWTRRRMRGLPAAQAATSTLGRVAGAGCSFDIECDDGNPCTLDQCDIEAGEISTMEQTHQTDEPGAIRGCWASLAADSAMPVAPEEFFRRTFSPIGSLNLSCYSISEFIQGRG